MRNDWVFATVKGLQQLEMLIENKETNLFRNRKVPREHLPYDDIIKPAILRRERQRDHFEEDILRPILDEEEEWEDEDKPLQLFTPSLKGYVEDVKALQQQKA
jgi:hypothetical protein